MNLEVLRAGGVDVDAALARMMGSEALLGRLLGKFTADQSCARFEEAVAADDSEAGLDAAHALKGVSGNLSMTRVFELTSQICELIRAGGVARRPRAGRRPPRGLRPSDRCDCRLRPLAAFSFMRSRLLCGPREAVGRTTAYSVPSRGGGLAGRSTFEAFVR